MQRGMELLTEVSSQHIGLALKGHAIYFNAEDREIRLASNVGKKNYHFTMRKSQHCSALTDPNCNDNMK
jgi:hypothetical protein